jgi:hypothetical protein
MVLLGLAVLIVGGTWGLIFGMANMFENKYKDKF